MQSSAFPGRWGNAASLLPYKTCAAAFALHTQEDPAAAVEGACDGAFW
jgi:hypothetical protein